MVSSLSFANPITIIHAVAIILASVRRSFFQFRTEGRASSHDSDPNVDRRRAGSGRAAVSACQLALEGHEQLSIHSII